MSSKYYQICPIYSWFCSILTLLYCFIPVRILSMFWLYSLTPPNYSQTPHLFPIKLPIKLFPLMPIIIAQMLVDLWLPLEYGKLISVYTLKRNLHSLPWQKGIANDFGHSSGTMWSNTNFIVEFILQVLCTVRYYSELPVRYERKKKSYQSNKSYSAPQTSFPQRNIEKQTAAKRGPRGE